MRITILKNSKTHFLPSFVFLFLHLDLSSKPFSSLSATNWWMAKNNKYASINFNHIYDNKPITTTTKTNASKNPSLSSSSSFSSASYSAVSAPNKHGKILVLTRPTPKPISHPTPNAPSQQQPKPNPIQQQAPVSSDRPRSEPGSDSISLRPLGRTGAGSSGLLPNPVVNAEKEKNLPMKSDKFVPPHLRPGFVPRENLRPKSGGNERTRRVAGSDSGFGSRPNSSG